ncbi:MAG: mechanosensitive ion channel domain-containing protein [Dongiaceae bacterium]
MRVARFPDVVVERIVMRLLRYLPVYLVAVLTLALSAVAPAQAQQQNGQVFSSGVMSATGGGWITPDQARRTLEVLQDESKRNQLIGVLQTISKASDAAANNAMSGAAIMPIGATPPASTAQTSTPPAQQPAAPQPATPQPAAPQPATPQPAAPQPATQAPAAQAPAPKPAPAAPATPAAAPASAPAAPEPAAPAPAALAPAAAAPVSAPAVAATTPLEPDSLGAQLLVQGTSWLDDMVGQIAASARVIADLPRLWSWLRGVANTPSERNMLFDAVWRLAAAVGCALLGEWLLRYLLRRPLGAIEHRVTPVAEEMPPAAETAPSDIDPGDLEAAPVTAPVRPGHDLALLRRVPLALLHFVLELLPVVLFAIIGNALLSTPLADVRLTRLAGLAVVNAYVISRVVTCVMRFLVLSSTPGLRLLPVRDETAAYMEVWTYRVVATAMFGWAAAEIARLLGLSLSGHSTVIKIVSLIVHVYVVIIILQCRRPVSIWLHAKPRADGSKRRGPLAAFRNQVAALWHFIAIFLVMASWVVWAIDPRDGFSKLMQFCLVTAGVLAVARLIAIVVLGGFDRLFKVDTELDKRFPGLKTRANRYYPMLRGVVTAAIVLMAGVALLEGWGLDSFAWFHSGEIGGRLVSALITIAVSAVVAVSVWEGANIIMDRHMARLDHLGDYAHAARMRTLLPIIRTVLLVVVSVVVIFTFLSEIGVNIAPLLAGASIIGVAVGFGSQKLVQDFITGIFLLLENAMQVGDTITASGLSGTVEKLSIRTIRLRAGDGAVHIIPFSSVGTVTNVNRGIGNAAVKVTVAAKEDTDRVGQVLTEIAEKMRADDDFKYMMRSDLQLWGVDAVDGGTATIVGQIVCTDGGRWGVQREFNRRMKKRFDELGIEIASPTQTIILRREDGQAEAVLESETATPPHAKTEPAKAEPGKDDHGKADHGKSEPPKVAKKPGGDDVDADEDNPTSVRHSPPPSALGHTE